MYYEFCGTKYMGSLTQNHPRDPQRQAKWNIGARYYALNVVNAICYNQAKTVEFRFLRPTFNFNRIELWLFIFEAVIQYAELYKNDLRKLKVGLFAMLTCVYPKEIVNGILVGLELQNLLTTQQQMNGDEVGSDTQYEDFLFDESIFKE